MVTKRTFLLMRCQKFHDFMKKESVKFHTFGPDHPPPPLKVLKKNLFHEKLIYYIYKEVAFQIYIGFPAVDCCI